jgi:hypothetical protein
VSIAKYGQTLFDEIGRMRAKVPRDEQWTYDLQAKLFGARLAKDYAAAGRSGLRPTASTPESCANSSLFMAGEGKGADHAINLLRGYASPSWEDAWRN